MKKPVTTYTPNPKSYKDLSAVVQHLHNRIFSIYRYNPIQRLEKSVLRGEGLGQKSKYFAHKPANSLFSDHQISLSGFQILNLPKQPFGKHQPYNEHDHFISEHFVSADEISCKSKANLTGLVRKFKVVKKASQSNRKRPACPLYKSNNIDKDVYKTKAGSLFCTKQKKIVQLYDEQVNRLRPKVKLAKILDDESYRIPGRHSSLSNYSLNSNQT